MMVVTIEGVRYELEVKGPNHGTFHHHDDVHPDGSRGDVAHHHHGPACAVLFASLTPLEPPPFEPQPAMYRAFVVADKVRVHLTPDEVAAIDPGTIK